eukprot:CAMPEP_0182871650 /NCGR_PEP_ID=MMETSP0034_2-20130328/11245_1 /TAXON_ID=156128 /ORGANISM="Nephroselmis pyriformis, Strain CCMP717" /LENGTH=281 /DNA_ID=CAMNT_0025004211 /DNA_START=82 /DNA_END=923 /DNA_ORIENTATION=-
MTGEGHARPPTAKPKKRRVRKKNAGGGTNSQKPQEEPFSDGDSDGESTASEDEGSDGYKKGGYHPVNVGEKYNNGRYTVQRKLGWGHFSTVWLCNDATTGTPVALKVQKSASHYSEAAHDEIELLSQVSAGAKKRDESAGPCCVVTLLDHFEHDGPHGRHVCMVFEVLGDNLLTLIKRYNYRGVPIEIVRNITRQILVGCDFLHRELSIIHTDLKPENVLLCRSLADGRKAAAGKAGGKAGAGTGPASPVVPLVAADGSELTAKQRRNLKKKAKKKAKKQG